MPFSDVIRKKKERDDFLSLDVSSWEKSAIAYVRGARTHRESERRSIELIKAIGKELDCNDLKLAVDSKLRALP